MEKSNFVDQIRVFCKSGHGGAGIKHFRRDKLTAMGGPDGGDGGRGGHIILKGNSNLWTLLHLRYYKNVLAENGEKGSDNNKTGGKFISADKKVKLSLPISKRNKNFIDVLISLCFVITFPIHLFLQKKPIRFFRNVFDILFLNKTWVGYSLPDIELPRIKEGVLTTTGLPPALNTLPPESLRASDKWYAIDYDVWEDMGIVWRGYRFLGS